MNALQFPPTAVFRLQSRYARPLISFQPTGRVFIFNLFPTDEQKKTYTTAHSRLSLLRWPDPKVFLQSHKKKTCNHTNVRCFSTKVNGVNMTNEKEKPHLVASTKANLEVENYKEQLNTQLESIAKWNSLEEPAKEKAVSKFMRAIGQLFLDYFHNHLEEAKACGQIHKSLLKDMDKTIDNFYVTPLMSSLELASSWEEPWGRACLGRTNMVAFTSLFGDLTGELDIESLIVYMDKRKQNAVIDSDIIPKNTPKSHWWWFVNK